MDDNSSFSFIKIGSDGKVGNLTMHRNIMIVDDLSQVDSFVNVGERGEIVYLDADGNELHTPESYRNKLTSERGNLKRSLEAAKDEIDGIDNELVAQKIKNDLSNALSQSIDADGEFRTKDILRKTLKISKKFGCAILTAAITHYLGFS